MAAAQRMLASTSHGADSANTGSVAGTELVPEIPEDEPRGASVWA